MLFELPTADEIDALALTSPNIRVRRFDVDKPEEKADLNYAPCKGQVLLVVNGPKGTAFSRGRHSPVWTLPSGRIGANEDVQKSVKRVAGDFGLSARSTELNGIYDVVFHYSDISIKRLHLAYEVITDDDAAEPARANGYEVRFFKEPPPEALCDELVNAAVSDCTQK